MKNNRRENETVEGTRSQRSDDDIICISPFLALLDNLGGISRITCSPTRQSMTILPIGRFGLAS